MSRKKILIPVVAFTLIIIVLIFVLNPSHKYNSLSISESKWKAIQEARIESKNLILEDIKFNDYKLIIDEKSNTLYYSLINDSQNKYNPNVSYSINSKNGKLAVLSEEITSEKVKSNYQFKIMIYDEKEYHIYNLKCTDFPILNISYNGNEEISEKNIPMEMYLLDNLTNIPNKITISSGKVKMNGSNYVFSLHMLTPGKNKRNNRVSILNMKPNSEYTLTPISNEPENDINTNHRVELFLNNEYKGVYFLGYVDEKLKNDTVIPKNNNKEMNNNIKDNKKEDMNLIYIKVNNQILDVELEENLATKELKEKLKNGDIIVNAHEYGGFEIVGDLGFSLPREDTNITTSAGDIVLYQGNQISLFYNSNSWSYTKLGKIQNISSNELKNILGNGDVTITFTLFR